MKPTGERARALLARPDPKMSGILLHGADPASVAFYRRDYMAALLGENAGKEMRLTRLAAADLRAAPSMIADAIKDTGFFAGPRAVWISDAGDAHARALSLALDVWRDGDAQIIATAGRLGPSGALRKLFEGHKAAAAVAIHAGDAGEAVVRREFERAGLALPEGELRERLAELAAALGAAGFRGVAEKLALYRPGDDTPPGEDEIALCTPPLIAVEIEALADAVAHGRIGDLPRLMALAAVQGLRPVALCIGCLRHFRRLHTAMSDPGGIMQGLGRLRPPVFGPMRSRMVAQARAMGMQGVEAAIAALVDLDLQLRAEKQVIPIRPLAERCLMRLALRSHRQATHAPT